MAPTQTFRVVSIEPTGLVIDDISTIAGNHNFELKIADPSCFSAPFCGNEYFTQEFRLICGTDYSSPNDPLACMQEIQNTLDAELAEGYVELV